MNNDELEEDSFEEKPLNFFSQRDIGLVVKISLTIIFVVSFAVCLTALLTYFNFGKSYSEITQARYLVLGGNLKKSIEYSLNVGVNLDEIENAQALVSEVAGNNTDIDHLSVVTVSNRIIYDKDKASVSQQSLYDMKNGTTVDGSEYRLMDSDGIIVLSMPIQNNFGEKVGEVQLGYSSEFTTSYLEKTAWFLFQHTVLSISLVALLVLMAVYVVTRNFRSRLANMGSALANLMQNSCHDPDEITEKGNFEETYLVFHEKTQELLLSFDAASRDLDVLEKNTNNA